MSHIQYSSFPQEAGIATENIYLISLGQMVVEGEAETVQHAVSDVPVPVGDANNQQFGQHLTIYKQVSLAEVQRYR